MFSKTIFTEIPKEAAGRTISTQSPKINITRYAFWKCIFGTICKKWWEMQPWYTYWIQRTNLVPGRNVILSIFFIIIAWRENICNLIGWHRVHISHILRSAIWIRKLEYCTGNTLKRDVSDVKYTILRRQYKKVTT